MEFSAYVSYTIYNGETGKNAHVLSICCLIAFITNVYSEFSSSSITTRLISYSIISYIWWRESTKNIPEYKVSSTLTGSDLTTVCVTTYLTDKAFYYMYIYFFHPY